MAYFWAGRYTPFSIEGRSCRDVRRNGRRGGAREQAYVSLRSGGLGSPSAGTKTGCLRWLDAARMKGGKSARIGGLRAPSAPGSTVPGTKKRHKQPGRAQASRVARREAPASRKRRGTTEYGRACRRATPLMREGRRKGRRPARGRKEYGRRCTRACRRSARTGGLFDNHIGKARTRKIFGVTDAVSAREPRRTRRRARDRAATPRGIRGSA
jgi:hypothetical protein